MWGRVSGEYSEKRFECVRSSPCGGSPCPGAHARARVSTVESPRRKCRPARDAATPVGSPAGRRRRRRARARGHRHWPYAARTPRPFTPRTAGCAAVARIVTFCVPHRRRHRHRRDPVRRAHPQMALLRRPASLPPRSPPSLDGAPHTRPPPPPRFGRDRPRHGSPQRHEIPMLELSPPPPDIQIQIWIKFSFGYVDLLCYCN